MTIVSKILCLKQLAALMGEEVIVRPLRNQAPFQNQPSVIFEVSIGTRDTVEVTDEINTEPVIARGHSYEDAMDSLFMLVTSPQSSVCRIGVTVSWNGQHQVWVPYAYSLQNRRITRPVGIRTESLEPIVVIEYRQRHGFYAAQREGNESRYWNGSSWERSCHDGWWQEKSDLKQSLMLKNISYIDKT
jgi:hypothetical protein